MHQAQYEPMTSWTICKGILMAAIIIGIPLWLLLSLSQQEASNRERERDRAARDANTNRALYEIRHQ